MQGMHGPAWCYGSKTASHDGPVRSPAHAGAATCARVPPACQPPPPPPAATAPAPPPAAAALAWLPPPAHPGTAAPRPDAQTEAMPPGPAARHPSRSGPSFPGPRPRRFVPRHLRCRLCLTAQLKLADGRRATAARRYQALGRHDCLLRCSPFQDGLSLTWPAGTVQCRLRCPLERGKRRHLPSARLAAGPAARSSSHPHK